MTFDDSWDPVTSVNDEFSNKYFVNNQDINAQNAVYDQIQCLQTSTEYNTVCLF